MLDKRINAVVVRYSKNPFYVFVFLKHSNILLGQNITLDGLLYIGMNSRQWSVSGCDVRSDIPSPVRRASFDSLSTQFPWSQFHATIKNQNSHYDNIAIHNTERHRSLKSMRRSSTFNGSRVASDSVLWNPCYLKRRASNLARSKMETFGSKTKTKNSSRSRRSLQLALKHLSGKDQQHNKTLTPLRDLPSSIPVLCRPLFNVQGLKIKVPIGLLCVFAPTNVNETNSEPEQQRKLLSHVANQVPIFVLKTCGGNILFLELFA